MSIFNELKDYIKERKQTMEYNKTNKQMKKDIKKAKEYLSSFKFAFQMQDENFVRNIDEHNLEYCFLPKVWKLLDNASKMAVMIKFSEKYNSKPLKLDDFKVPDSIEKQEDNMYHLFPSLSGGICFDLDYDVEKLKNPAYVIETVLMHDDLIKEQIFLDRAKHYKSILDFKSIDELKYMINTREKLFATYFPDALNKDEKLLHEAIRNYEIDIEYRASLKLNDVYNNIAYYAKEAEGLADFLDAFRGIHLNMRNKDLKIFGSPENLKMQTIKFVYDIYHPKKDLDFQKVLEHFMPMKESNYDESLFPYIDLSEIDKVEFSLDY